MLVASTHVCFACYMPGRFIAAGRAAAACGAAASADAASGPAAAALPAVCVARKHMLPCWSPRGDCSVCCTCCQLGPIFHILHLLLPLLQVRLPDGNEGFEPCPPTTPGAQEVNLQYFADKGTADRVVPPKISRLDFEKVLLRARPTVSHSDLGVFERFTEEFGEEAS